MLKEQTLVFEGTIDFKIVVFGQKVRSHYENRAQTRQCNIFFCHFYLQLHFRITTVQFVSFFIDLVFMRHGSVMPFVKWLLDCGKK